MGDPITQDNRLIAVITNAGKDVLLLDSVTGMEGVSRPFRYVLGLMSEQITGNPAKVIPHQLVGTSMSVKIGLTAPETGALVGYRFYTGLCERFVQSGQNVEFASYSATIVPFFSFLNYATDCRIFQNQNVPTIVTEVINAHGYGSKLDTSGLTKSYTNRDYCVQYRETDFAFISRLLESEGIAYYFEHRDGDHTMVLVDAAGSYKNIPVQNAFKYAPVAGSDVTADSILKWEVEESMHPGQWTTRDYHHEAPANRVERSEPSTTVAAEGRKFGVYEFPGETAKIFNRVGSFGGVPSEAAKSVRTRMEKEESAEKIFSGVSKCRSFTSGYKVSVDGGNASGTYLLTEISLRVTQQPAYRNLDSNRPPYQNTFAAITAATPFVPPMITGRTVVQGLQTAFVIDESPSGNSEEIWPDKFGRVRVRFNWDRESKYACWVRVVQPWAGKAWGQQYIPRVGDEVAITFLEGDPDCPVIIGGVYNATNMPIFSLPDNKTQSGILTHSTKGGGTSNYNMLRFEDKLGGEEIYMQAEKDWNSLIKHDETRTIKNDRTSTIHVNESRTVETGNDTIAVQQGNRTITVQQNIATTSNQGNISTLANKGNIAVEASLGNITIQADAGQIVLTAAQGVTIRCGASTISITPQSVSINSPMLLLNS